MFDRGATPRACRSSRMMSTASKSSRSGSETRSARSIAIRAGVIPRRPARASSPPTIWAAACRSFTVVALILHKTTSTRRWIARALKARIEAVNPVNCDFRFDLCEAPPYARRPLEEIHMKALNGTKTHDNLKAAFAGESQANRRYLYFAAKADVEGHNDVSALFRSTAEGETGHAHGHLEYLEAVGDPATNLPIGRTRENLKAAVAGETHEYTDMYPGMAKQARDEGFGEIADWFETLAKAERSHANRFQKALDALAD